MTETTNTPDQSDSPTGSQSGSTKIAQIILVILTITAILCWSLPIINPDFLIRSASAEQLYHTPAIDRFAPQLPTPDYSDYSSATTPGYHTVLAVPASLGATNPVLRIIASTYTFIIIALLAIPLARTRRALAIPMILPLLASNYFIFSGAWLLPDNSGWLGVLIIILLALKDKQTFSTWLIAGFTLTTLIFFRQVHIWAAAPIWAAAWIGSSATTPAIKYTFSQAPKRFTRTIIALLCTLPAFVLLYYFLKLWGGLVTPTFKEEHHGPNPATPAYILLQISIISVFFAPILLPKLNALRKSHAPALIATTIAAAALAIIPQSSYNQDQGRFSGWWNLIKKIPDFADRSPIYIAGAIVGSWMLIAWGSLLTQRDRWILGITLLASTLAQTANLESWQRYHEPLLLIVLMLILARSQSLTRPQAKLAAIGSLTLSIMLAAVTASLLTNQVSRDISDPRVEALDLPAQPTQNQRTTPDTPRTTP